MTIYSPEQIALAKELQAKGERCFRWSYPTPADQKTDHWRDRAKTEEGFGSSDQMNEAMADYAEAIEEGRLELGSQFSVFLVDEWEH